MSRQRAAGSSGSSPISAAPRPWRNGAERGASMIARHRRTRHRLAVADQAGIGGDAGDQHLLRAVGLLLDARQAQMQRFDRFDFHGLRTLGCE